jgi:hypothetical protein
MKSNGGVWNWCTIVQRLEGAKRPGRHRVNASDRAIRVSNSVDKRENHRRPQGDNAKWHVTANEVSHRPWTDQWYCYRQFTPTDVLARDHG